MCVLFLHHGKDTRIPKACHPLVQILFEGEGGDSPEEQSHWSLAKLSWSRLDKKSFKVFFNVYDYIFIQYIYPVHDYKILFHISYNSISHNSGMHFQDLSVNPKRTQEVTYLSGSTSGPSKVKVCVQAREWPWLKHRGFKWDETNGRGWDVWDMFFCLGGKHMFFMIYQKWVLLVVVGLQSF